MYTTGIWDQLCAGPQVTCVTCINCLNMKEKKIPYTDDVHMDGWLNQAY